MDIKLAIYRQWRKLRHIEYWLTAQVVFLFLRTIRLLPPHAAINFMDRAARRIGPLTGRHRVALNNLKHAFPEKTDAERQTHDDDCDIPYALHRSLQMCGL